MLGFIDYEYSDVKGNTDIIRDAFLDISIHDKKFIAATRISTDQQVEVRVAIWKNKLRHVMENPIKYRHNYEMKKELFYRNPSCFSCHKAILTIDQAYLEKDRLVHRACITDRTDNKSRTELIKFIGEEESYEFDNVNDAIDFLLPLLKREIGENSVEIERLSSLDFIGTAGKLRGVKGKPKPLKIDSENGMLFMDCSGSQNEVISKMQEIASLYGFFEVVVD